jgi:hypothetical protein
LNGCTYEQAYELRQKVRTLSRIESVMKLHLQLHPEAAGKDDPLLIAAFHSGDDGSQANPEAFKQFFSQFDYLFVNCPKPTPEKANGLFTRLLRGISARFRHDRTPPDETSAITGFVSESLPPTFDLSELRKDLSTSRRDNREFFEQTLEPHLNRLEANYGNNIPLSEMEGVQQLIKSELAGIDKEREEALDHAAREGITIELTALRERLEAAKATYSGPNRDAYVEGLDRFLETLAAKYGSHVPLKDAHRIMEDLEAGRGFEP